MERSQKRLLGLVAALPVLVVLGALVYMVGMAQLEGEPRGFWQAVGWAAETLSTTGYGSDTTWQHPAMVIFVVVLQFMGVFLVFLIFPLYLIPFLEERFEVRLPKEIPPVDDHVVIYGYGAAVETLLAELARAGVETVVVEADEGLARRMVEKGQKVVYGDLVDDALRRAWLTTARTLIANGTDDENAAVILAARQLEFAGEILALVEDPFHRKPIMLAGATAAYTPRHILGAALAARASRRVSPTVAGTQQLSQRLRVAEIRVGRRSSLVGQSLAEAGIGQRTGVSVIAQWVGGTLLTQPRGDMRLEANGILVLIGSDEAIARFGELCHATQPLRSAGPFLVAGAGEVGAKVAQLLSDAGEEVRVIDRTEGEAVEVVGDVLAPGVFERAGVAEAQAVILAVDTDSATLFSTVILKDLAPEVPVIARVNSAENVDRIHRPTAW
jgi:Trk K+ transport system NAD-binding subunit